MELKAVVFDFDGVCIDTETARYCAWQQIYELYGQTLPLDEWIKNIGMADYASDPFPLLEMLVGKKLDNDAILRQHKKNEVEIANAMPLQPGFLDRLHEALSLGCKCAVASSSSHRWVDGHLRYREVFDKFTVTICREDTVQHKPHPEPYETALRILGVDARYACAVEDTPTGIAAAKAAGMFCIGVPCVMTRDMNLMAADCLTDSLSSVTFTDVERLIAQRNGVSTHNHRH